MRIQRIIGMNPIEPAQMSFRIASGLPLTLDLQYYDIAGRPLTSDIAGQLQLTARSSNSTEYYAAPATDLVNGKARVTIGQNVLTDMNGYRMRLTGTYRNEATLLALGTLRITEAAGVEAVPIDVIDDVPLAITYNVPASIDIHLWQDVDKGVPFDLATATITAATYPNANDPTILVPFLITQTGLPGQLLLSLTADQVNTLPAYCWWSLRASSAGGVTTLAQGTVSVNGTPP